MKIRNYIIASAPIKQTAERATKLPARQSLANQRAETRADVIEIGAIYLSSGPLAAIKHIIAMPLKFAVGGNQRYLNEYLLTRRDKTAINATTNKKGESTRGRPVR